MKMLHELCDVMNKIKNHIHTKFSIFVNILFLVFRKISFFNFLLQAYGINPNTWYVKVCASKYLSNGENNFSFGSSSSEILRNIKTSGFLLLIDNGYRKNCIVFGVIRCFQWGTRCINIFVWEKFNRLLHNIFIFCLQRKYLLVLVWY